MHRSMYRSIMSNTAHPSIPHLLKRHRGEVQLGGGVHAREGGGPRKLCVVVAAVLLSSPAESETT
jgi:hypothetical protein